MSLATVRLPFRKIAALPGAGQPTVDCLGRAVVTYRDGIAAYSGEGWKCLPIAGANFLGGPIEFAERLPGGAWLVAARNSRRLADGVGAPNALIISDSGAEEARFSIGDGVEDLQAGAEGDIWVSYSFLGTMGDYGVHGWGRLSPVLWVEPVGGSGLVRFDRAGNKTFDFMPPRGASPVMDAYALNVNGGSAWVCYHPGFDLVRVDRGGTVTAWKSPVWGVDALAVAGERVLLHHLGRSSTAWAMARLGSGGELVALQPAKVELDGEEAPAQRVVGRGSTIHLFTAAAWYRWELD